MGLTKEQQENLKVAYEGAIAVLEDDELNLRESRFDKGRLDKAYALAQDPIEYNKKIAQYSTTIQSCLCPDSAHRGSYSPLICKHRLAASLVYRMEHPLPPDWYENEEAMRHGVDASTEDF